MDNDNIKSKFLFEGLEVYQRSLRLAIYLSKIASEFPVKFSRIRDQLIGAAVSVPLNIAKGSGRQSVKERANFYRFSRTSVFEIIPIIEICYSLSLIDEKTYQSLREETIILSKMLNLFIRSL